MKTNDKKSIKAEPYSYNIPEKAEEAATTGSGNVGEMNVCCVCHICDDKYNEEFPSQIARSEHMDTDKKHPMCKLCMCNTLQDDKIPVFICTQMAVKCI